MSFGQNDPLMGESFWPKDRLITHILFELPYFLIFFGFGNLKVTVHKGAETIQGRKLFKGGNYSRKYGSSKSV